MNRIKVVICGKEYTLQTEEDTNYVYNLANTLEKNIINTVNKSNVSGQCASVMVALSLLDDVKQLDKKYSKMKTYLNEVDKIKQERDNALREVKRHNSKVEQLENSLKFKSLGKMCLENYSPNTTEDV